MRNALLATAGSALALVLFAYSAPASADVNVVANITKNKDIRVTERVTITKTVYIQVGHTTVDQSGNITVDAPLTFNYRAAAEADAIVNQTAYGNTVTHSVKQLDAGATNGPFTNYGIHLLASIRNSISGNTGIVDVNQDVGNMSNQGNQVALSVATPSTSATAAGAAGDYVLLNSQSEAHQENTNNRVQHGEDPTYEGPDLGRGVANESATIGNSINHNTGLVNVNQNAGNMNNQGNSDALAVAINLAGVALSEGALGQINGAPGGTDHSGGTNTVNEFGVTKLASMSGSLSDNVGVGNVNQAAGNMVNQANIFSGSFIDGGGSVGLNQ